MTEDDTFMALRRISYKDACAVYANSTRHLHATTTAEEYAKASDPSLRTVGWTFKDLMAESEKRMEKQRKEYIM